MDTTQHTQYVEILSEYFYDSLLSFAWPFRHVGLFLFFSFFSRTSTHLRDRVSMDV